MISPTVTRNGDGSWGFTWSPGTPPYSVWLDGILLGTVSTEAYTAELPNYETVPPALEIVSTGSSAGNSLYPPRVILQWRGITTSAGYLVEQFVSSSWVQRVNVSESGRGYYDWLSGPQDDGSTGQFRVTAFDLRGNGGTPLAFSLIICRNPAPPAATIGYSGTHVVVS